MDWQARLTRRCSRPVGNMDVGVFIFATTGRGFVAFTSLANNLAAYRSGRQGVGRSLRRGTVGG